jgi:hypothetical protein
MVAVSPVSIGRLATLQHKLTSGNRHTGAMVRAVSSMLCSMASIFFSDIDIEANSLGGGSIDRQDSWTQIVRVKPLAVEVWWHASPTRLSSSAGRTPDSA